MKKSIHVPLFITLLLSMAALALMNAPLHATAISMGGLETMGSDLSLDALRNPALLPLQKTGRSLGFFALAKTVNEDNYDATVNGSPLDAENTESIEANLFLSFVRNYGDIAWSLAMGNVGTGQFAMTQDEMKAFSYSKTTEKHVINPALFFSCGFRLTGKDTLGVQLRTAYSFNEKKRDIESGINTQETTETDNAASFLLKLGYLKQLGKTQVGATINSGTLILERLTGENRYNNTSQDYTGDLNVLYMNGPAFSVGTMTAFNRSVAMALEFKVTLPLVFRRDEPNFSDSSSAIKESELRYVMYAAAAVKGGFEFHLTPYWVFNCGAGVQNSSVNIYAGGNTSPATTRQYLMVLLATAGFDYHFSPNTALVCGIVYSYVDGTLSQKNYGTGDAVSIDMKVHGLDAFLGFNYGW